MWESLPAGAALEILMLEYCWTFSSSAYSTGPSCTGGRLCCALSRDSVSMNTWQSSR